MNVQINFSIHFLCLSLSWNLCSQSIFPTNTAIWQSEEITIAGPVPGFYGLCGDTIIGGQNYQKIFQLNFSIEGEYISDTYKGATRIEGDTVWYIRSGFTDETILYDFSLTEGETITVIDFSNTAVELTVDSVRNLEIEGELRKHIFFTPNPPIDISEVWIEGIGSNRGVITRGYLPAVDWEPTLVCYKENNTDYRTPDVMVDCTITNLSFCDFTSSTTPIERIEGFQAFPNPFSDGLQINWESSVGNIIQLEVLDNMGRQMAFYPKWSSFQQLNTSHWPSGVFFIRGIQNDKTSTLRLIKEN